VAIHPIRVTSNFTISDAEQPVDSDVEIRDQLTSELAIKATAGPGAGGQIPTI